MTNFPPRRISSLAQQDHNPQATPCDGSNIYLLVDEVTTGMKPTLPDKHTQHLGPEGTTTPHAQPAMSGNRRRTTRRAFPCVYHTQQSVNDESY